MELIDPRPGVTHSIRGEHLEHGPLRPRVLVAVYAPRWRSRGGQTLIEACGFNDPLALTEQYVADLAEHFGHPLIVVAPNRIGTINCTLLTLLAAAARPKPLPIAGIVLNDVLPRDNCDPAVHSNRMELEMRCVPPVLAHLGHNARQFDAPIDWLHIARGLPVR